MVGSFIIRRNILGRTGQEGGLAHLPHLPTLRLAAPGLPKNSGQAGWPDFGEGRPGLPACFDVCLFYLPENMPLSQKYVSLINNISKISCPFATSHHHASFFLSLTWPPFLPPRHLEGDTPACLPLSSPSPLPASPRWLARALACSSNREETGGQPHTACCTCISNTCQEQGRHAWRT